MCSSIFPTFPSIRFSVCSFMVRSLIHRDLSFVQNERYGSIYIILHADLQFDQHHLRKILPFSSMHIWILYQKLCLHIGVELCLCFQFQWSTCLSLSLCHVVLISIALLYSLRSGIMINPAALFLFQLFSDFLFFCMNSITFLSSYVKNCAAVFIAIAFNLQIASVAWLFIQC